MCPLSIAFGEQNWLVRTNSIVSEWRALFFSKYLENSTPPGGGVISGNLLSGESKGAQARARSPSCVHGTRTVDWGPNRFLVETSLSNEAMLSRKFNRVGTMACITAHFLVIVYSLLHSALSDPGMARQFYFDATARGSRIG